MGGQVVDTQTAEEFMRQALEKVSDVELAAIAGDVERKAERFHRLLHADPGTPVAEDRLRTVLAAVFGIRRKAPRMFDALGAERLGTAVSDLLFARGTIPERFDGFVGALEGFEDVSSDLAGELLHYTMPEKYWLWTKWMWDPATETGALRLVTMDEFDLTGSTPGETYLKVGEGVAFVHQTGEAVGFTKMGAGLFGIDVFLACVYGIYMYTVLRMRMTQEFNHMVPQLPELARRLLGVWRMEAA